METHVLMTAGLCLPFLFLAGFAQAEGVPQYTNRLAQEKNPYLLQHAHNPVDWYPWGREAFEKSKRENKPILLSIGYSTCHWCHVMEAESFEDPKTADIMNEHFVAIKVDREERPDIDNIYDGAVPSGNSMAVLDLLRLDRYTSQSRFREVADKTLKSISEEILAEPTAYPQMLIALDYALGHSREIVIAGQADDAVAQSMLKEIYLRFMPNKIIMLHKTDAEGEPLEAFAPFLKDQTASDGKTTAYVCQNYACALPVTDVESLKKLLGHEGVGMSREMTDRRKI